MADRSSTVQVDRAGGPGPLDYNMEHIGYQPEYSWAGYQRKRLRDLMDTLRFELFIIILVCVYAIVLFIDMTVSNSTDPDPVICRSIVAQEIPDVISNNQTLTTICSLKDDLGVLFWLDLTFLIIFLTEICFRLIGFGFQYLKDPVNAIDTVVVTLAFVISIIDMSSEGGAIEGGQLLNLLRIVRLFRLAVIINKLQRSREAAAMRSKRAMYRRLGAPVDKVLGFLTEFRVRQTMQKDQYNIDWMMEVIASDELYAVAEFDEENIIVGMQGASNGGAGDMSRYLSSETGLARRRAGSTATGTCCCTP